VLKHKVKITVSKDPVIESGQRTIRGRLLNFLFGEKTGVFLLTPGKSVELVEIIEMEGDSNEGNS
jgi:hypothetical protein